MEVFVIIIVGIFVLLVIGGILQAVFPFVMVAFGVVRAIWPFILGSAIGIPLSLRGNSSVGNGIVGAGLVGTVAWIKSMDK